MVTSAINLKVIVPRQADEAGSAATIWAWWSYLYSWHFKLKRIAISSP